MLLSEETCLTVPMSLHGKRMDAALAELMPDYSRSQLTSWLKQGKITVDGRTPKPRDKVTGGERIDFLIDLTALDSQMDHCKPEDIPLDVIYEDDQVLLINKPAGFVVHPGAGNPSHTLVNALLFHAPELAQLPRAGIIHRLDKDTTGLLIVAKTLTAHTNLTRQMQERSIQRSYVALVQGHLIAGSEIDTCYGRHPRNRLKMAVCKQGKQAITRFSIRKQYQTFTLLDVQLLTGRTHQIRVHMAHINHPVVGDQLYGGRIRYPHEASEQLIQQLQLFKRQALHAKTLTFQHPANDKLLTFEAPLPEDFQLLLDELDTHLEFSHT